ncbi:MAG: heme o synthase [Acidobacteriota bacterium]|nr:heme o synthase [Acidobacteriota bacterium]MDH3786618.1 heme o synthase [Acidobacteriota bacterium]
MSHSSVTVAPTPFVQFRNLVELGKPRLSFLVVFTAGTGIWLMPASLPAMPTLIFLFSTSALVAAANTLNCWIERDNDRRMQRTCNRPLPTGRVEPRTALAVGLSLATVSLTGIALTTNLLTAGLGLLAFVSYAWIYTPMKRVTPWAVLVGSLPGALPPLMGSTAVANEITWVGMFAFGILFIWQLPHFIAISLYLRDDFERGEIRVLPLVYGERVTRYAIFGSTILMLLWSLLPLLVPFGGTPYLLSAGVMGIGFVVLAIPSERTDSARWARRVFLYSLVYLPVVLTALVVDLI